MIAEGLWDTCYGSVGLLDEKLKVHLMVYVMDSSMVYLKDNSMSIIEGLLDGVLDGYLYGSLDGQLDE